ncbi:hypothetical protein NUH86_01750 [Sphingobium sp. JS3065]|uniref:hypothetical protein n=1 Tax=Sphingobium sp. JS3065 TaxID=2970925 RepID=UPI002264BB0A|nr:hypothetical protein [Sphingobium sp. JS3065]UZW55555.1 hypothetical protein NUH86_01750 [Sphingobium sp. JS3065]
MGDKQGMSFTPRSGDTHVIGEDGEVVNVDAQTRSGVDSAMVEVPQAGTGEGAQGDGSDGHLPHGRRGKAAS